MLQREVNTTNRQKKSDTSQKPRRFKKLTTNKAHEVWKKETTSSTKSQTKDSQRFWVRKYDSNYRVKKGHHNSSIRVVAKFKVNLRTLVHISTRKSSIRSLKQHECWILHAFNIDTITASRHWYSKKYQVAVHWGITSSQIEKKRKNFVTCPRPKSLPSAKVSGNVPFLAVFIRKQAEMTLYVAVLQHFNFLGPFGYTS